MTVGAQRVIIVPSKKNVIARPGLLAEMEMT